MNIRRLIVLQIVLLGGLSAVFALPKHPRLVPPTINLSLPDFVGDWYGRNEEVSEGERQILGPDTQFARKKYTDSRGNELHVSIVLSGPDMNTSIHRPERCLPAQGWTVTDTKRITIPTTSGEIQTTRLHNVRSGRLHNGQVLTISSLNYYWFVGRSDMTPSHIERTWIDIRDRVLKGYNQQWAYVSVLSWVSKDYQVFGRNEQQSDALIQSFISELVPALKDTHAGSAE
jgi:EpsI family protein